ncbi:MAG TPA: malto-oligosyltrehalose synthase [Candidatus Limnocylindrales bacterium]|nr:malto-oligosyltrehalose synthase [Candidatus Limnocylindrales bacterium]
MPALRIPIATYRLQFNPRFRFEDARGLVPYLDALGITDLYASPLFQARRESTHGYDVTDPTRLNQELGSEEEFDALVSALKERDMGLLLDIVPNHMSASSENRWWMDVLENGAGSPYAPFFDIDWHSSKKAVKGKVLLPILGGPYGRVLENQELSLCLEKSGFLVRYNRVKLPLSVKSYLRILSHRIETLEETYGADSPAFRELWELIASIEHLPDLPPGDSAAATARFRKEEEIRDALWRLNQGRPEIRSFLEENIRIINGRKGNPESFEPLDRLLSEQHYWLSFWRLANEEINYRRFFAVSDLVSLRVEDPRVFEASHELVLRLAAEGKVTGLRVDHIDGLYDPLGYLASLKDHLGSGNPAAEDSPGSFYIVVEKILQDGEIPPPEWPVFGTTGYGFLNAVNGVFVSARGAREMDGIYARFLGAKMDFGEVVYRAKKLVMDTLFAGEMHALGQHLGGIAEQDRYGRDLPRKELRQALIEVTACFPVYRTYIRSPDLSARDRLTFGRALKEAQRRGEGPSAPVFDFLNRVLMLESPAYLSAEQKEERLRFLRRWQQFTGPIMAKGWEDTALYLHNRLVSLNEVGGNPASAGVSLNTFHRRAGETLARWPHSMNATSTHDTKRSEDVRARINVLSELPKEWEKRLLLWSHWNEGKKRSLGGRLSPDRNEEFLLYQTLLGVWPLDDSETSSVNERVASYMVKAVREGKVFSQWIRPDLAHEGAVCDFVASILEAPGENRFLADFLAFQKKIAHYGALNGLAQVLLKIASPGVPDFYQGTELWDFSLVDPDNRRPVDYPKRALLLNELLNREGEPPDALPLVQELLSHWRDGRIKLFLTCKALNFRKQHRELFLAGSYLPLPVTGGKKELVIAFARERSGNWAIAAVPRLMTRLVTPEEFPVGQKTWGAQGGLLLPEGSPDRWSNALTGEAVYASATNGKKLLPLSGVFRHFPAALLAGSNTD